MTKCYNYFSGYAQDDDRTDRCLLWSSGTCCPNIWLAEASWSVWLQIFIGLVKKRLLSSSWKDIAII